MQGEVVHVAAVHQEGVSSGDHHVVALAPQVRIRDGAWERLELLAEMADEFFPLPDIPFGYLAEKRRGNGGKPG